MRERSALAALEHAAEWDSGYSREHATRPQTIGYALVDSPAALAAWIVEKLWAWTDHDGHLEQVLSRDEVLDNLMLYWLSRSGASSARLYWQSIRQVNEWISGRVTDTVDVPTGCSIFAKELQRPSRRWAERRFVDIRHWSEPERGGHFEALEQPELHRRGTRLLPARQVTHGNDRATEPQVNQQVDELGHMELDRRGAELLFQVLTEREVKKRSRGSIAPGSDAKIRSTRLTTGKLARGSRPNRQGSWSGTA